MRGRPRPRFPMTDFTDFRVSYSIVPVAGVKRPGCGPEAGVESEPEVSGLRCGTRRGCRSYRR